MLELFFVQLFDLIKSPEFIILGAITLFEVAPIKINPWSKLFHWIGNAINGDIKKELSELKREFELSKAEEMRWNILNYANSCRKNERHSKDEWRHVVDQIKEYKEYTTRKNISNGVIEEDAKYLMELYHERNLKNDFLEY